MNIKIIKAEGARKPNLIAGYKELEEKLSKAEEYEEPLWFCTTQHSPTVCVLGFAI